MAEASRPLASAADAGSTTFSPGHCTSWASSASECSSGVRTPPPNGARTVTGQSNRPSDR